MEMNERIQYDTHAFIAGMEAALDRLSTYRYDSKFRELLGEDFQQKLAFWDREIRNRKNDPFTLVVCGDFKRGKSSFINALLGEDVAPTNITTETVTLNRISYGAHSNELLLSGGRKIMLTDEELGRDSLEKIIEESGGTAHQLHIRRPIELLKDITIVDTPGMGDALKNFDTLVEQALRQADAVVYLFSVNYPLSQREQLYLKTAILPQWYTSLYVVGNFADTLHTGEDWERMEHFIGQRMEGLMPGQKVYMLSALDERCRQLEVARPNPAMEEQLAQGFDNLRSSLTEMIQNRKDNVLPGRMHRLLKRMLSELSEDLSALEQGLDMSTEDIQKAMEELEMKQSAESTGLRSRKESLSQLTQDMGAQASAWLDEMLSRMEADTANLEAVSQEDIRKFYSFFCVDTLQTALERCIDLHTQQLYEHLEQISQELVYQLSRQTAGSHYDFSFTMQTKTWTRGDNVGFFADTVLSRFSISAYLVALGIGGAMRGQEMKDQKGALIQALQDEYPKFRTSVHQTVERSYEAMRTNAQAQLEEYYTDRLRTAQTQLNQMEAVARQSQQRKDEIRCAIGQIRGALTELEQI